MTEAMCAVLLSWAVSLTGYAAPEDCPEVRVVDREALQAVACNGHDCRVAGYVHYAEPDVVYIWDGMDMGNPRARAIVVHEMVHVLQMQDGWLHANSTCDDKVQAEREAYAAENQYLMQYGRQRETYAQIHCGH